MPLYHHTGVSVESYVEMESDVPMRYEVDQLNDQVVLYCGHHAEYVLTLSRKNLAQFLDLGGKALNSLNFLPEPAAP